MSKGYKGLEVWQKEIDLAVECYRYTETFPSREVYGIVAQIRQAAASVPANIAEGQGRRSVGDFIRFVDIAYGSLTELETHLILAERLSFLDPQAAGELLQRTSQIGRMLNGLRSSLRGQRRQPMTDDR